MGIGSVEGEYMSIPLSEFENLHEQIRLRGERIAQLMELVGEYSSASRIARVVADTHHIWLGYKAGQICEICGVRV